MSETPEMVERVARAIADAFMEDYEEATNLYDAMAEAAILAMAQPTKAMTKAMCRAMSPERRPVPEHVSVERKHAIRWEAGARAALGEKWPPAPALPQPTQP